MQMKNLIFKKKKKKNQIEFRFQSKIRFNLNSGSSVLCRLHFDKLYHDFKPQPSYLKFSPKVPRQMYFRRGIVFVSNLIWLLMTPSQTANRNFIATF